MKWHNPFEVTKAVHYSNEQLHRYWVNFPIPGGFESIVKPASTMPMVIIGGKGSGKTHVMKHFSYELQKLRSQSNGDIESIINDQYLGIYFRAGNLNSKKFKGSEHSEKGWQIIFEYYLDLFVGQLLLEILIDLAEQLTEIGNKEEAICELIAMLFDDISSLEDCNLSTFQGLKDSFRELQRKLDYEVNNSAVTGDSLQNIRILSSGGKLILGIPKILVDKLDTLSNVQFTYLIDEFENFTEHQQIFINTLIREVELPVSFKIGSRLYGIKTKKTFSAEEELRTESEYEEVNLDFIFRQNETEYTKFIQSICISRLKETGLDIRTSDKDRLKGLFEPFDINHLQSHIENKPNIKHRRGLLEALNKELDKETSDLVLRNLSYDKSYLIEKAAFLVFFQNWKKPNRNLLKESEIVKSAIQNYDENPSDVRNPINKKLDYFKNDLIDQLCRTYKYPIPYVGLDNFIKMSAGIPRLVLIILKHVYRWAEFYNEHPFRENPISIKAQDRGVRDAISWFLKDAVMPGEDGVIVQNSLDRLGRYLHELRFSDSPPECSICVFSVDKSPLPKKVLNVLSYLEQYSYIILVDERRDKNSDRRDATYQIIGIVAPQWELSINRRGAVRIDMNTATKIFAPAENDKFRDLLGLVKSRYNAPFIPDAPSLFD